MDLHREAKQSGGVGCFAGWRWQFLHARLLGLAPPLCLPLQAALHATKADKTALPRAAKKAEALLRQLVDLTLRTDLTRIQRTNLETCITVHMHQKEVRWSGVATGG